MGTLLLVMQMLPAIIRAVTDIEAIMPQSGLGATKLQLIVQGVTIAYADLSASLKNVPPLEKVILFIEKYASFVVGVFNQTGVFKSVPAVNK